MAEFFVFVGEQWILVGIFMILVYLLIWHEGRKSGALLGHHEATRLVNEGGAVFVDVREAAEFGRGHISGAVNLPFASLADNLGRVAKHRERTLILIDKMGQHSGTASRQLQAAGHRVRTHPESACHRSNLASCINP